MTLIPVHLFLRGIAAALLLLGTVIAGTEGAVGAQVLFRTMTLYAGAVRGRGIAAAALLLSAIILDPESAGAANFEFGPPTMSLTANDHIATVTLTNTGDAPLRFEIEAFRWDQKPNGELQLDPTEDLVVFPRLVTLAAHETRRIRVAVSVPAGEAEKTYRVQITEIPQFSSPSQQSGATIEMRSQLRLPIFFAPITTRVAGNISNVAVRRGTLTFSVINSGTVHFVTKNLAVAALGPSGASESIKGLDGWYVLAGGHRDYSVALPHCAQIRAVTIAADAGSHVTQTIELPADACRP